MYLGLYQIGTLFIPDGYLSGNEFQVNFMSDLVYKTVILFFYCVWVCNVVSNLKTGMCVDGV